MSSDIMILFLAISAVIILSAFASSGHFFRSLFLSGISGTGALFAVSILSQMTGVYIGINLLTLAISFIGGIPSVIAMLAVRFILLT